MALEKIPLGVQFPLKDAFERVNEIIDAADKASSDSITAKTKAEEALANSESTQTQLNQVVIDGDSSVEAAQARVDSEGVAHTTLKERLDQEHNEVTAQLAQTMNYLSDVGVNVKANGAKGNGLTDDLQAINLAIESVQSLGGGTVYFPNTPTNIYLVSDTLLIPSNIKLLLSDGVTVKLGNGVDKPLIENTDKINGNENIKIIGGIFDINPDNQTIQTACINFEKLNNSYFENVEVPKTKFTGYIAVGSFHLIDSHYNIFKNCSVHESGSEGLTILGGHNQVIGGRYYNNSNGSGVSTGGAGKNYGFNTLVDVVADGNKGSNIAINTLHTVARNCKSLNGTGNNGITLGHQNSPAHYSTVIGCTVDNCNDGIRVLGGSIGVILSGNTATNIHKLDGTKTAAAFGVSDGSKDCTLTDNIAINCDSGYVINTSGFVVMSDNQAINSVGHGFNILQANNSEIHHNISKNNGAYGLNLGANATHNKFSYNECFDDQTTPTQQRGIYDGGEYNDFSHNTIFGNVVRNFSPGVNSTTFKNKLSTTDKLTFDVDLVEGTSQTINNENVMSSSRLNIIPKTKGATERNLFISATSTGYFTIGMNAGTVGDKVTFDVM